MKASPYIAFVLALPSLLISFISLKALYYVKLAQVLRPGGPLDIFVLQDENSVSLTTNLLIWISIL